MAGRSSGTDDVLRALGKRLRALRAERGWTQEYTASSAGITLRMLQRMEGAETNPTVDTLVKVAASPASTTIVHGLLRSTGPPSPCGGGEDQGVHAGA